MPLSNIPLRALIKLFSRGAPEQSIPLLAANIDPNLPLALFGQDQPSQTPSIRPAGTVPGVTNRQILGGGSTPQLGGGPLDIPAPPPAPPSAARDAARRSIPGGGTPPPTFAPLTPKPVPDNAVVAPPKPIIDWGPQGKPDADELASVLEGLKRAQGSTFGL